ncbi:hypothetical protein AB1286_03660 [Trinickia sp. NRRL B-1857]|uniref:hypothetical protein n=1 Tax=Trinickia sp. NRRL B-1857 TaxID=3162879 RepID=UPI003D2DA56C
MRTISKIRAETIESLFEGAANDFWVGKAATSDQLSAELDGDYIPALVGGKRIIFGFNKHFIYSHNVDLYSYESFLLKNKDGTTFLPAQQHRYLGLTLVNDSTRELLPACAGGPSETALDFASGDEIAHTFFAALDHFLSEHPEITQYLFEGPQIAEIVRKVEEGISAAANPKLKLTFLTTLAEPYFGFEITRPSAQPASASKGSATP